MRGREGGEPPRGRASDSTTKAGVEGNSLRFLVEHDHGVRGTSQRVLMISARNHVKRAVIDTPLPLSLSGPREWIERREDSLCASVSHMSRFPCLAESSSVGVDLASLQPPLVHFSDSNEIGSTHSQLDLFFFIVDICTRCLNSQRACVSLESVCKHGRKRIGRPSASKRPQKESGQSKEK